MGNQLTGVAPSQILPVEQYLTDVPQFHFIEKYVLCCSGYWILIYAKSQKSASSFSYSEFVRLKLLW